MSEPTAVFSRRQITDYLEVPLYRPRLVLIPLALCTLGALTASFLVPKMYRTSTVILVESGKVPDSFVPKIATEDTKERLFTLKQQILSRTRLERIIRELNLYPEAMASGAPISKLIESMREAITINVQGTDAFLVEYVNRDPATAMRVANRLASLFIEQATQARADQVEGAYDFIQKQLEEARTRLEANEEAVRIYKQQHLGTLPEQLGANLAALQRLQMEQQSLNDSIRAAKSGDGLLQGLLQKTLADQARAGEKRDLDPPVEIAQLRDQLAGLRSRYTGEHPDVQALVDRIARLENSQQRGSGSNEGSKGAGEAPEVLAAKSDVRLLTEQREEIDRKIAAFQARVEQTPRTEQELGLRTRDSEKLRENYLDLLNKKFEAQRAEKLEERWKGENFKTLDPAHLPERAYYPNRLQFLAVGFLLGLTLGVGLAFTVDFLDHSLKTVTEVEDTLPYPVLAVISHVPSVNGGFLTPERTVGTGRA